MNSGLLMLKKVIKIRELQSGKKNLLFMKKALLHWKTQKLFQEKISAKWISFSVEKISAGKTN